MRKVQGNDSFQRINYLYQVSICTAAKISKHMAKKHPALSSYYGNVIVNIAKKNVQKIHPDIKRQICKKCRCMLINNFTTKEKIKNKYKSKTIEWLCTVCGTKKALSASKDKDHRVWVEKPEAIVEVIT